MITINMAKAREIHLGRLRAARDKALAALDVPYMQADEAGDAALKSEIAAKKQALRALPETVDLEAARDTEELKAIWPEILATPDSDHGR